MTKVFFLLSAAVMALACFFSWQNRESFVNTRKERQKIDNTLRTELKEAEKAANEVVTIKGEVTTMAGELESEKTRLEQAQIKLRNAKNEADRVAADLATSRKEFAELKVKMEAIPQNIKLENIGEELSKQKTTIAENEDKAKKIGESVAAKEKELKRASDDLADILKRIEERKKLYNRNSLVATIVAVNNDWGFVVIDAGKNKEITSDTKLIVTRGNETIGKLTIVSVDNSKTVANIDLKSLRRGTFVAPGDRVILETLFQ